MRRRLTLGPVVVLLLLPLLPVLMWAVAGPWRYPDLLPATYSSRGLDLLTGPRVLGALGTSVLVSTCVAVLAVLIGLPAGRALGRHRFRGRGLVLGLLLLPVVVPPFAATLGLQVFFIRYGLSDTLTGVVLVQLLPTVPYAAVLLTGAFTGFDSDLELQARALGAGPVRTVVAVTLPLLRPALVTTFLLTFLISWSDYVLTLLVGGGRITTLPLLLFAAIGGSDRTAAAALGLLVVLPPVLFVIVVARWAGSRDVALLGLARG